MFFIIGASDPTMNAAKSFVHQLTHLAILAASLCTPSEATPQLKETLHLGHFGAIHIYRQSEQPKHLVLFVSGDGGWDLGMIDMARALTESAHSQDPFSGRDRTGVRH